MPVLRGRDRPRPRALRQRIGLRRYDPAIEFELATERLGFTRFDESDAPLLAKVIADPLVARTITANVRTLEQQLEVAAQRIAWHNRYWESDGLGVWGLRLKTAPDELIGWCGFTPAHLGEDAEILYGLATRYWGRGLISEAAEAAATWLWANTEKPGISATVFAGNPASERIAEKLGMTRGPDLPISDFAENVDEVMNVIAYDLWRLESASTDPVADEIGHRIGQMTGAILDSDEVWSQVSEHLPRAVSADVVRRGFDRGLANPAIMYFRADRPA